VAAEKHLHLLAESATRTAGAALGREEALAKTFEAFLPADYLEQIRKLAYELWDTAENRQRSALEFWLAAGKRQPHATNRAMKVSISCSSSARAHRP
jgi:hypothetical protein